MNTTIECFGEIKCPAGLASLVEALQQRGYAAAYRNSFEGQNHSATIQFDENNELETNDSDGHNCLFSGEFTAPESARQLLTKLSQDLATLDITHRFEAYQEPVHEPVCYVHFQ